ncbi:putative bifunctional diguanylate cyclase/phosphodiesterase [Yoonia sp. MH D7]
MGQKTIHTTISIGFALADADTPQTAQQLLRAASIAQLEASRAGPDAIRSYSNAMHRRIKFRDELMNEVQSAVEKGQIKAYFQPQISLQTLQVTGLEALARWEHPEQGTISPAEFLPAFEQAGLMRLLGNKMLSDSLAALASWDQAGLFVPKVSINMSNAELRNPNLVDHIMMELDRYNTSANRLVIEVLETVVASTGEDIIERNLRALARLGCEIDLDDFGTGHASITSIRKFSINRIKIDRSFVTHIDRDEDQQNMASAILTMASGLTLATLAEGVETLKEQAQLTAMGCGFMQGYALSHPLSLIDATAWISQYEARQHGPAHLRRVQ